MVNWIRQWAYFFWRSVFFRAARRNLWNMVHVSWSSLEQYRASMVRVVWTTQIHYLRVTRRTILNTGSRVANGFFHRGKWWFLMIEYFLSFTFACSFSLVTNFSQQITTEYLPGTPSLMISLTRTPWQQSAMPLPRTRFLLNITHSRRTIKLTKLKLQK